MLSGQEPIISHNKIISIMEQLGYPNVIKGVCNGLAQMWIQALFCQEGLVFIRRLHFICLTPDLFKKIAAAKEKKGINLSIEDQKCIDVLAFLDGVQIYQNYGLYTHLFEGQDQPHHLDAATISKLTAPLKLQQTTILEIFSENRMFNIASLQRFLNPLLQQFLAYYRAKLKVEKQGWPVSDIIIALHSSVHKIVLRYVPEKTCWELTDANHYDPFDVPSSLTSSSVIETLLEGSVSPVNISVFSTSANALKNAMQRILEKNRSEEEVSAVTANMITTKEGSLLVLAAMRGDAKKFLECASKYREFGMSTHTARAINTALYHGQTNILEMVISTFPYAFLVTNKQYLLYLAIKNRLITMMQKLIFCVGANVNNSDGFGRFPFHTAVEIGYLEGVKALVAWGANYNLPNDFSETPLILAVKHRQTPVTLYLAGLKDIDFEKKDIAGESALTWAVKNESYLTCEALLRHHADFNYPNEKGETAALLTCETGQFNCLQLLITFGANLNILDKQFRSTILVAMAKEYWDIAALLVLKLRTLDAFNPFSYSLLIQNLTDVVRAAADLIASYTSTEKQLAWQEIKYHRNVLGMVLQKNPQNEFCKFFKPNEKKRIAYIDQLKTAKKPKEVRAGSFVRF